MTAPASPTDARPWSAFLQTDRGHLVRVPHFVGTCPNCHGPSRVEVASAAGAVMLDIRCEAGCGVDGRVKVAVPRGGEGRLAKPKGTRAL